MYSALEAAKLLGCSIGTLKTWTRDMGLNVIRKGKGGYFKYSDENIEELKRYKSEIKAGKKYIGGKSLHVLKYAEAAEILCDLMKDGSTFTKQEIKKITGCPVTAEFLMYMDKYRIYEDGDDEITFYGLLI